MQEISTTPYEINKEAESQSERHEPVTIRAPRAAIWDWFLMFSTLGFYSNFWFYGRAKELNQISKSKFIPWLWLFAPLIAVFQIFALKKLGKTLEEFEHQETALRSRRRYFIGSWGFVLSILFFSVSSKWAVASWLEFVFFFVYTFSFVLITSRMNDVKRSLNNVEFKGKQSGYSFIEWVLVIILFPTVLGIFTYASVSPFLVDKLEHHSSGSVYRLNNEGFSLTFRGDGWYRVEPGSYSDGTALTEFTNGVPNSYFLLFKNNNIQDIDEHMRQRRDWVKENVTDAHCTEARSFVPGSMNLKIELVCKGSMTLAPSAALITLLQTKDHNYELLGVLSAPNNTYKQWLDSYQAMAREFTAQ
ncbi:hypothetical protein [Photobacterium sp. TY1-4]|uniref:hypothetical protein n=1 Tax=Photobacterium sp. TY1-4 TaxID=2899122 RepID=UPI0021BE1570|nr:hypothetical protein [Photobacterium sp. TY1-4]UXI01876.1 hypothetical protein NH461_03385 [Photobacterium sp. TY1-4]